MRKKIETRLKKCGVDYQYGIGIRGSKTLMLELGTDLVNILFQNNYAFVEGWDDLAGPFSSVDAVIDWLEVED